MTKKRKGDWSYEEINYLLANYEWLSDKELAQDLNRTSDAITMFRSRKRLLRTKSYKGIKLYKYICNICGAKYKTQDENSKYCSRKCYGKSKSKMKYDLREMQSLYATGLTQQAVANKIGCNIMTVNRAFSRNGYA